MKKMNTFSLIKYMLGLIKDKIYLIIFAVLCGCIGYLLSISITFFAGLTILKILDVDILNIDLNILITIILLSGFMRGFLRYVEQYLNHYMAFTLLALVRNNIFSSLRKQGSKIFEESSMGEILTILQSDTESLEVFYAHTITPLFIAILTETVVLILFGVIISYFFSLFALISYLMLGLLIPILFYICNKKLGIKYRKELSNNENNYLSSFNEIYEILFFQHEKETISNLKNSTLQLNKLNSSLNNKALIFTSISNSIIMVSNILIILIGSVLIKNSDINSYLLILSYMMLATSFGPVVALSNLPSNLTMSFASARRIYNIEHAEIKFKDGNRDFDFDNLEIKNLSFSYDGTNKILKDINLSIKKGMIIALDGKSGAGKSTLLKLLLHFEEANDGVITYNGININDLSRDSISKNITLFSQSTYLFKNTIRYNMLIAKPDANDEEIYDALKKAQIYDKVMSLDKKLDTIINDDMSNFSTGEKQRLGLARVFLHNSKLLLLDEITSNVDAYNESLILKQLLLEKKDKAIIIISHKKTSLSIADKIYKLEDGVLCS